MKEKSKRTSTRIISLFLSIMMLISVMPAGAFTAQAVSEMDMATFNQKLEAFKRTYPDGKKYDNKFYSQCFGFANHISYYIFGSFPTDSMSAKVADRRKGWTFEYGANAINKISVGDVVRYKCHSIFITGISGNTVTFCHANGYGGNIIYYNEKTTKSTLRSKVSLALSHNGADGTKGWVAHCTTGIKQNTVVPEVKTGGASNISNTSATISGSVTPQTTASSWGFSLGTSKSSLKDYNVKTSSSSLKNISCDVKKYYGKDLTPGKTYYYRLWAKISGKKVYGKDIISFTTTSIKPPKSTIKITKQNADIGIGDAATVTWSKVSDAKANDTITYIVKLVDPSGTVSKSKEQKGTTYSFGSLKKVGTYKAYIIAKNSAGETENTTPVSITVHNNVTVTFYDSVSNTVISTQSVVYGHAANAPKSPPQTGYTFVKWDKAFSSVKSNITVNTVYEKKSYTVKFVDNVTNKVLKTQSVKYEEAATAPAFPSRDGYTCTSWSEDFSCVRGNMTINPVYEWYDSDYSVSADIQSVKRCNYTESNSVNEGYDVEVKLTNNETAITRGRLVVALKTSNGKLLATTESSAFSLASGAVKNLTVFVPYEDLAYKAEVYVINQFATAGNIAATKSVNIDNSSEWSGWSTTAPPESASDVESRTEYRYRDKEFKTSSSKTLSGYTLYNTTSAWGAYGAWSSWSDTKATASDSRKVETRQVEKTAAYTQYRYYGYYCSSKNKWHFCKYYGNQLYGGSWSLINTGWINKKLSPSTSDVWTHKYASSHESSTGCKCPISSSLRTYSYGGNKYYWYETRKVDATYKTQYRYADRSKVYTYHFYKWGDWSNWSTTKVSATDNKQVETRTVYRYKTTDNITEPTSVSHRIEGSISPEYSGENAVVYVYKFDQASDYTIEYIGTTTIGENGSVVVENVKFLEEPSVETGDFTVSVAVEGSTTAMYLTTIEAPKPKYTVEFYSDDDVLISTQEVTEGQSAELPEAPEKEGYYFTGWSQSTVNVRSDLKIKAEYAEKTYIVAFVDWEAQDVTLEEYKYGEELEAHMPAFLIPDEDIIVEWDKVKEGVTTVTENMVVCTEYTAKEYDADIYGYEGELLDSQSILSGSVVELPEIEDDEAYIFEGWANSDTGEIIDETIITEDTTLYPVYTYSETASEPESNVKTEEYNNAQTISLNCETEDAAIFYTTDGSDPSVSDTATEYEEPFIIDKSCVLKFYAVADKMNDSLVVTELCAINSASSSEKDHILTVNTNIYQDRETLYQSIVKDGYTVDLSEFSNEYGYNFEGLYYDSEFKNRFNEDDSITESLTLYAKYSPKKYTALFVDSDGTTVLSRVKADYLAEVYPPSVTAPEGYVFTGWDSYDYMCMYQDATFTAQYAPLDEYTTVLFEETEEIHLQNGSSKKLIPVFSTDYVNSEDITWDSSDWSVARVDSDGVITGVGVGKATITVTVDENDESASVDVNVFQSEYDCNEHKEVIDKGYAATCTTSGLTDGKHCELCGKIIEEQTVINPLGHNYDKRAVVPTCDSMGYTEYTCTVCGDTFMADHIAPLGHKYQINISESSCTDKGEITYTCTVCGNAYTEHYGEAKGHIEETLEAVEPTCTKAGLTEGKHCIVCGKVTIEQNEVAALGHNYMKVLTAPTCLSKGYTTYTCTRCGDSYRTDYTDTTAEHDYKGVVTKLSTCTTEGVKTFTCSVCGDIYTEPIEKNAHTPVIDAAVPASYTAEGKTEGKHCSVCGEILVAQKTVAKLPKKTNPLTVKAKTVTIKYSSLKNKNQNVAQKNAFTVTKAQGKVTYKKSSGNSKITVSSAGKITVKKGLKKGTYKIKVKITAAGNATYKSGSKTVTVTIKVK